MATTDRKLGTPDIPFGSATFTTYASTPISAPAALVFRILRNTETWRDWNIFIPRVTITYQPPEENDHATNAEIAELVRNTSIAGSVDSDITDGAAPGTKGLIGRRMSIEEEEDVRLHKPAVTRERLRSIASTASGRSGSQAGGQPSGLGERPISQAGVEAEPNGAPRISAAQRYMETQASRKASVSSGQETEPTNNVLIQAPNNPSVMVTAPPTAAAHAIAKQQKRNSGSLNLVQKHQQSIHAIYGEPSIRIQVGTKMNFHCRMHIPTSYVYDREIQVIVTEVARPDDPRDFDSPFAAQALAAGDDSFAAIRRTETHTLSKTGVYRIVWTLSTPYTGIKAPPKFLWQTQRVHEIRAVRNGDGSEGCVYEDWECQRGVLAKTVKSKYGDYLQGRFVEWGRGLKGYCEAMGGAVERRDFVG